MLKPLAYKAAKILSFDELREQLRKEREKGTKVIQCHGVFDLLHPGHIRHFREAKNIGGVLIVTLTPDRFVNKGPGRPAFTETLRLEAIAALEDVDFVVLNDSPDAVSAIRKIQPHFYVKGMEYSNASEDVTGKISEEKEAVESAGGSIYYTNDIVFSSSSLLNRYFDSHSPRVLEFINELKQEFSSAEILHKIEALSDLKVLVIGDAIIDEYQYTNPLGQSGKGIHMVARCGHKETFLGGALIIANHVAQYAKEVTLVSALGKECPHLAFIEKNLDPKVVPHFTYLEETTTLIKKRYVLKDGKTLTKLFETYSGHQENLKGEQTEEIIQFLNATASEYDLVLISDFGNGFTNPQIIDTLSDIDAFTALNTQTNSGNRGFNAVTNYRRADYISLNEPELRLSAHDRQSSVEGIMTDICQIMDCRALSVTRGVNGVISLSSDGEFVQVPALMTDTVDRVGAGDCYLALSALCLAKGYSNKLASFIGSVAAAISVQMTGNQEPIKKIPLCKFITRLMK